MSRVRNYKPIGIDTPVLGGIETPGLGGIETPIGLGGIETPSGSTPQDLVGSKPRTRWDRNPHRTRWDRTPHRTRWDRNPSGSTPGLGGIEPLVMRGFDPTDSWGSIPDFHSKLTSNLLVRSLVSLLVSY